MTRLLVGNDFGEELRKRPGAGWWVQRLVWFAQDGDILVLPVRPEEDYLRYVTSMTGTRLSSLKVIIPPPGHLGAEMLTSDRLRDKEFLDELGEAVAGAAVDSVLALFPDAAIASLAEALGLENRMPGYAFVSQGGGAIVNSKAFFRAVAAGAGAPIPEGTVCPTPQAAEEAVLKLLAAGHVAILKHEFLSSGKGNEILSPYDGVRPIGARSATVVTDRAAVHAYLAERWDALSGDGRNQVVVERYFPDSAAAFAEFLITDEGIEFGGQGDMLSEPFAIAQIIPAPALTPDQAQRLVAAGRLLCEPLHAMGYRGRLSADGIVTPDGDVLFTEYNGRVTGSTHVYAVIGEQVVGADYARDRVLFEHLWPEGWTAPSFAAVVARISGAGLAYDPATRTGVVLASAFNRPDDALHCCVVAESLAAAQEIRLRLEPLFTGD
ncbi:hypothetical protein AF335_07815 [Streptomyces eurocidicus]|uniref:ATP-grasp domain-containing protein n=1 Tax=Streptomyces eurocidicus TaxID=66423 RepID=A0A2N8P0G2_STREU|nr:peptide ligase PGM1-related protein [Streptomyces eurocidicus]MBB5121699.1 hypothetical protein [Streptomyces eurocidicus]MBF6052923.1 hypothetical protein [Streptomyces eurocidicus]PNE34479.1 hypothetical protein AF335_07815 [Streptomyces eurocidicus]